MRVVQVGKFYPPEYLGGLETVVVNLTTELVRRGIGVTAVVSAVRGRGGADTYGAVRVVRARSYRTVLSPPITPTLPPPPRRPRGAPRQASTGDHAAQ